MKISVAKFFLLLALTGVLALVSGCASVESDNASVRPWNTPQGWDSSLSGMDMQHR